MTPRLIQAAIAVALLTGLTACGSASSTDAPPSGAAPSTHSSAPSANASTAPVTPHAGASTSTGTAVIIIKNFGYSGATTVPSGATVTVTNHDGVAHTLTADKGDAFDVNVGAGQTKTFVAPKTPGTYPYHCDYHGNMHGTLKVS